MDECHSFLLNKETTGGPELKFMNLSSLTVELVANESRIHILRLEAGQSNVSRGSSLEHYRLRVTPNQKAVNNN